MGNLVGSRLAERVLKASESSTNSLHVKFLKGFVDSLLIAGIDFVFLLVGHMTNALPLSHEVSDLLWCVLGLFLGVENSVDLSNHLFLGLEVLVLYRALARSLLFLLLKEVVASCDETFPHGIAVLLHHWTNGSPLLLEGDKSVGCSLPLGRILQSLGFLAQLILLSQIDSEFLLHLLEEDSLLGKEVVARLAETSKQSRVHLA